MDFEDLEPRPANVIAWSQQDLTTMSIDELEERISDLRAEIKRCEDMIESKQGSRKGAESFFKK